MRRSHSIFLQLLFLVCAGLAVRLVPLLYSKLPYNIDGFPLVRIAEDVIATGHWSIGGGRLVEYNTKMPGFSLLLSCFSLVTGLPPLQATAYFVPVYTIGSIVMVYALTLKVTRSTLAAFLAGAFLALGGFYVYLTTAAMKEAIGLALLPLLFISFHQRADARKRVISAAILVTLPLVHHLTTLVAFTFVTMMVATQSANAVMRGRLSIQRLLADLSLGPGLALLAIWYYRSMDLSTMDQISRANDIALYLSVFLLATLSAILVTLPPSTRPWLVLHPKGRMARFLLAFDEKVLVVVVGIAFVVANNRMNLFGSHQTSDAFLWLVIPYLLLALFAVAGFNLSRYSRGEHRALLASLFLAPLTLLTYALLKGLDPLTFALVYRSYNYVDFGLALCVGIGAAFVVNNLPRSLPSLARARAPLLVSILVLCAATTPLAYNWQEVYGIESVTHQSELDAMAFISDYTEGVVGTDQRLTDIASTYYGLEADESAGWDIAYGREPGDVDLLLLEKRWTSVGLQEDPFGNIVVPPHRWNATIHDGNLVYSGGSGGSMAYVVVHRG